jgi:hypothetical protein
MHVLHSASYAQEMDTNADGFLDYDELCSQLRRQLEFRPRIHITMSDYDVITQVSS